MVQKLDVLWSKNWPFFGQNWTFYGQKIGRFMVKKIGHFLVKFYGQKIGRFLVKF